MLQREKLTLDVVADLFDKLGISVTITSIPSKGWFFKFYVETLYDSGQHGPYPLLLLPTILHDYAKKLFKHYTKEFTNELDSNLNLSVSVDRLDNDKFRTSYYQIGTNTLYATDEYVINNKRNTVANTTFEVPTTIHIKPPFSEIDLVSNLIETFAIVNCKDNSYLQIDSVVELYLRHCYCINDIMFKYNAD